MGRAIDMEKDIQELKSKFEQLDNAVRGMMHELDEMSEKSTKIQSKTLLLISHLKVSKADAHFVRKNNKHHINQ